MYRRSGLSVKVRHSKKNPNWTTPQWVIDDARRCLGGTIDLDPFSSATANKRVKAARYFDEHSDGFAQSWDSDAIFINPPGLMVARAWRKLTEEILDGHARKVFWVGFSVEQLCVLATEQLHPCDFSMIILRKRISFVDEDGTTGSPSHGNYIVTMGVPHDLFVSTFTGMGKIIRGDLSISG